MKINATDVHARIHFEVFEVLKKYSDHVTLIELLAIMSNIVGKLVAAQDQRKASSEQAMEIVTKNILIGNSEAVSALLDSKPAGSV